MHAASVKVRWGPAPARTSAASDPVAVVRAALSVGDEALDYGRAKLAFDQVIDPGLVPADTLARLDELIRQVREMASPDASPDARIAALRRLLHVAGPWNDFSPLTYDRNDPLGQRIDAKLLANYLASRRGNCVSMPALFVILADRLGLDVAFATAPLHVFVRYRSESGRIVNIEATNGGHPARDEWYREQMPMNGRAIGSGIYMRALSKREGVALLATTVLEWLIERGRHEEAARVAEAILQHAPRDVHVMVKQATAYAWLLRLEFEQRYAMPTLIPPHLRARYFMLAEHNRALFEAAEALGWEPV